MDYPSRRERLADRFEELRIDGLLVSRLVNVRYLTGFTGTAGQLLLAPGDGVFFTDFRYEEQAGREVADLPRQIYQREFPRAWAEAVRSRDLGRVGFEAAGVTYREWRRLEETRIDLVPVEDAVERLRWAKDADEMALIERAQAITDRAFDRVAGSLSEGVTERQVAVELDGAMLQLGADRVGFDPIVAFGEQAAEPHHHPTERALRRGDVVKLDFGCVVDGYHSDMTRTVAFGEPQGPLREVYEVVRRAQSAGIEAIRAGVTGGDADRAARAVIGEAGYGDRFGHSVGHGVGLEIHEGPSLRTGGRDRLPRGAVVTVEPGVYLPAVGGVRIEDMVVVEEDGCRPLPGTPKDLLVL